MSGENRVQRRKGRFHRSLAVMLAVLLFAGQSHIPALAQEDPVPVNTKDFEENELEDPGLNDEADVDDINKKDEETDTGTNDEEVDDIDKDSENESSSNMVDGNNGTDSNGDSGDDSDDSLEGDEQNTNDTVSGDDEQDECVCEMKCTAENINLDCPLCLADYTVCAGQAEQEEEQELAEDVAVQAVSGNHIALAETQEDVVEIAEGDGTVDVTDICIDHVKYSIKEQSGDRREVKITGYEAGVASDLVIPSKVIFDGKDWDVVGIERGAFKNCMDLLSLEIPGSVLEIGDDAFMDCRNIKNIQLDYGIEVIGETAFMRCHSLESIDIPDSVTFMGIDTFCACLQLKTAKLSSKLSSMPEGIFGLCGNLQEVHIPEGVREIGMLAFFECPGLYSIDIPQSVYKISCWTFNKTGSLKDMKIAVDTDGGQNVIPIEIEYFDPYTGPAFWGCPDERYLTFMNADGTKRLTGEAYERAKAAYLGDASDGDATDDKWHGWQIEEPPVEADKYTVTIYVNKDDAPWPDHGKTFALRANGGTEFITDLTQVENGTYNIYDITGINPDSYWSKSTDTGVDVKVSGENTEVTVTVKDADVEETLDYYTAAFWDGAIKYEETTAQKPQVVLKGKKVIEPAKPQ